MGVAPCQREGESEEEIAEASMREKLCLGR